jgi:hypothetical protein
MPAIRRPWRPLFLGLGALALVLAGCKYSGPQSSPAPEAFSWVPTAAPSATAQQALAVSLRDLHLCGSEPTVVTTIWVVTGTTYGMAVLTADCHTDSNDTRQTLVLVQLGVDTPYQPRCPHWQLVGETYVGRNAPPPNAPADVLAHVPAWLPLPPDAYASDPMGGGVVTPSWVQVWESATREFIAGRFRSTALRPPNAQALTSEPAGWVTEDHGLVSVVLPQPGDWTFFFAGTAAPAQVEDLARRALPHADDLLPWPSPLPANQPVSTPAC